MAERSPILRPASRGLIIGSDDRLLLFHHREEDLDDPDFWMTPGGGLDDGESFKQALQRELWEELGLTNARRPGYA